MIGTMEIVTTLVKIACGQCAGIYAVAQRYYEDRQKAGGDWHCPYCNCTWGFSSGNSENDRLKKEKEQLEATIRAKNDLLASERARHDQTRASLRAQRGVTTRILNRTHNGVCPHCNRHFENLHRHMQTKHKDQVHE